MGNYWHYTLENNYNVHNIDTILQIFKALSILIAHRTFSIFTLSNSGGNLLTNATCFKTTLKLYFLTVSQFTHFYGL